MEHQRRAVLFAFVAVGVGSALGRAQEEEKPNPDVMMTKKLLEKAEQEYQLFLKKPITITKLAARLKELVRG